MTRPSPALCLALSALAAFGSAAIAQTTPTTSATRPTARGEFRSLDVTPAAPVVPLLRDALRVPFVDRIEGNAAPLYLQAFGEIAADARMNAIVDAMYDHDGDDAAFARWLGEHHPWFDTDVPPLLATPTLRDVCDWSTPIRFEHVRALLPYLNRARQTSNVLRAKFRLALARGDVAQAIVLLRTCSVMADRLDDGPTFLVSNLVSVGMQAMCVEMAGELMGRADGPNLYWSLRQYDVPFGNLRGSMEAEQAMMYAAFPTLRKARDGRPIVAADWAAYNDELATYLAASTGTTAPADLARQAAGGLAAMAIIVPARAYYAETRKLPAADVAKLDPLMVAAVYTFETYRRDSDAVYRWYALPYPQMLPGLRAETTRVIGETISVPGNLFSIVAPALRRAAITNARLDRTIAAFAAVEAIRAYAAAHDGRLPSTLDAIVDTPPPANPVTGRPFDYAVKGEVAILSDDGALVEWPLRYEVRLRK